ncbi:hypothetical protein SDC9_209306 [bioreactor metagenome]|uniref:Uncharacterized protein n=1 Tax=bioreactor metagenome TaxID=1076179 RepID=A0A645JCZ2_9ZZZZ
MLHSSPNHLFAFFSAKERSFVLINSDGNNDTIKELGSPLENIQVPIRDRIKTARVNRRTHVPHNIME